MKRRNPMSWVVLFFVTTGVAIWTIPYYLVFTYAIKSPVDQTSTSLWAPPHSFNASYFIQAWQWGDLTPKFFNSLYISSVATAISIGLAFFTAFSLGIGKPKHRTLILTICMVIYAIPQEAIVFPWFKFTEAINIYGNQIGVILILGILYSAFATYLLTTVLSEFPKEILEAAYVDGVSSWRLLRSIVFPLIRPTLATLAAMIFIWDWNEYMMPLILLPNNNTQTLPIIIATALGGNPDTGSPGMNVSIMAMGCVLSAIPSIIFFLLFQRTLSRGIAVGAVD
jgi:raffinose/stachyose/melibiose transport system permease protein